MKENIARTALWSALRSLQNLSEQFKSFKYSYIIILAIAI